MEDKSIKGGQSIKALQTKFIAVFCRPEELRTGSVWSDALSALLV